MNKLLHNNTLFTLTLLGIATALAFLFFSFVSENTANIALLYIIVQILIARYTNGYLHVLFSSVFSVICINFFFTYPFFRLNFTLSGYPVTFIGMLIITLLTTATTSSLLSDGSILSDAEKRELLENIENDSSWLLNMVENLLSVTRINDTVTHQVNKTPEIVEEVVAEAVQRLKKRFPSASIIVHVPTDYLPDGFIEYQKKLPAEIIAFQTLLQQKKYPEAHYKLHLLTTEFDNRRPQPAPADDIIKNIVDEVRN